MSGECHVCGKHALECQCISWDRDPSKYSTCAIVEPGQPIRIEGMDGFETLWVSVKDRYPLHRQKIKIKVEDIKGKDHELECIFNDCEDYRSWEIKFPEDTMIHAKPTHWMPLPEPSKEHE